MDLRRRNQGGAYNAFIKINAAAVVCVRNSEAVTVRNNKINAMGQYVNTAMDPPNVANGVVAASK